MIVNWPHESPGLSEKSNYQGLQEHRSLRCDVGAAHLLIGPNGSGKSNFLDALRFCSDALRYSLDQAVRERGGINEVRRRATRRPNHLALRFEIEVQPGDTFRYFFEIASRAGGGYAVQREECEWINAGSPMVSGHFKVDDGVVGKSSVLHPPAASNDRLYLVAMSGLPHFNALYRAFSSMGFYNLSPERIKGMNAPDADHLLRRDGSNAASVLAAMVKGDPDRAERVFEFLGQVVPGVERAGARSLGPVEILEFFERASGDEKARTFLATSVSDGTLRALGVLIALFQRAASVSSIPLVALEEPEMALHPAAAEILLDALREAAQNRQVLVTSHSPDLLDRSDIPVDSILAVSSDGGRTSIAPIDHASKEILRKKMRTAGELMRINQVTPDLTRIPDPAKLQMRLF